MSKAKGDKLVLGNSMQSLATLLGKQEPAGDGEVRQLFSQRSLIDQLPEGYLEAGGTLPKGCTVLVIPDCHDPILEEAIANVKAMTPEQLKEVAAGMTSDLLGITQELVEEPDHHGETSHGLNPKWIDWYCAANNCRVWKAISEGKRRLRAAKETPKRKKRPNAPK